MPDEAPVQRRLAAIFAGDVVGYSRLMGVDEVGTLRSLKAVRRELTDPAIAAHHGRIAARLEAHTEPGLIACDRMTASDAHRTRLVSAGAETRGSDRCGDRGMITHSGHCHRALRLIHSAG